MSLPTLLVILNSISIAIVVALILFKKNLFESSKNNPQASKKNTMHLMVHELRSPVTAIKDAASILISGKSGFNKQQQKQFLRIIYKQSKLLLDQISAIIDAEKLEEGKLTVTKIPGDIAAFVNQQTKMFLLSAKKKNISLKVETLESLPTISFDPIRIGQVLNNLISNSLKFTKEAGEVSVKVTRKDPTENYVTVSVSDTGIGISPEFQKKLFSKFAQSAPVSKEITKQGSGLGLYMVKGIIDAHGGSINVESEPGKGTTISFSLPI